MGGALGTSDDLHSNQLLRSYCTCVRCDGGIDACCRSQMQRREELHMLPLGLAWTELWTRQTWLAGRPGLSVDDGAYAPADIRTQEVKDNANAETIADLLGPILFLGSRPFILRACPLGCAAFL